MKLLPSILYLAILNLAFSVFNACCAQWAQLNSGSTNTLEEIFFPTTDTGYVVGANGTILKTTDGLTWIALSIGSNVDLKDVFFLDTQTGFVTGDSGIFAKTTDGGVSWNVQHLSNSGYITLNTIYFIDAQNGFAGGSENYIEGIIFKTTDGGVNWTIANTPTSIYDVSYKRIFFPDTFIGYAVTRGWCIKTIDGGNNWFMTDTSLFSAGNMFSLLEDEYFFSADTGFIVGWYNPFTGYTNNGGVSWVDDSLGQWFSIDFPSRQKGYIVGWNHLVKTTDGGATWIDISSSEIINNSLYSVDFTDDTTGYACGDNGVIIKTATGGTTSVDEISNGKRLKIFPNPSNGNFEAELQLTKACNAKLELINMFGEILAVVIIELVAGKNQIKFAKENRAKGIYFLNISADGNWYRTKICINQ